MTKMKPLKKRLTEDPGEECKRVDEEYALAGALVRARAAAKLRVGTPHSAIVRLEGGRVSPSSCAATPKRLPAWRRAVRVDRP